MDIYSASELNKYIIQQKSVYMLNALAAAALIGIFLIGVFSHSKKSARLAESILLFFVTAASLGVGFDFGILFLIVFGRDELTLVEVGVKSALCE